MNKDLIFFLFNHKAWQEVGNKEQDRESGDEAEIHVI